MPKPYYETELGKLYHGDCLEIMPMLEPVDLVLTDPPWNLNYFKDDNKTWDEYAIWLQNIRDLCLDKSNVVWIFQSTKAIPYISHLFKDWGVFASIKNFCQMTPKKIPNAFDVAFFNSSYGYKGNGRNWCIGNSVNDGMSTKQHPTYRPYHTIQYIIDMYSLDLICDPFIGSGTTAVACKESGRRYIGIEISPEYCEIARNRIKAIPELLPF